MPQMRHSSHAPCSRQRTVICAGCDGRDARSSYYWECGDILEESELERCMSSQEWKERRWVKSVRTHVLGLLRHGHDCE